MGDVAVNHKRNLTKQNVHNFSGRGLFLLLVSASCFAIQCNAEAAMCNPNTPKMAPEGGFCIEEQHTQMSQMLPKIANDYDKHGPYITFFVIRHGPTENNLLVHGTKYDGDVLHAFSNGLSDFRKLASVAEFKKMYSSDSARASGTLKQTGKDDVIKNPLFNEQKLGCFEGKRKSEIRNNPTFLDMMNDPDKRIPAGLDGEIGESGREVISRLLYGVYLVAKENDGPVCICTSQCAMNWLYRYLSNNHGDIIDIDNYGVIMFNYYKETDALELLTTYGAVTPSDAIAIFGCRMQNSPGVDSPS
jgi:broad specificity phosphatase PhoE